MKRILTAAAFSILALGANPGVMAGSDSFGLSPAACEDAVARYMDNRLSDPRSARIRVTGDPYKVMVSTRGRSDISAWAVDVLVKSRLPTGSWSGYQPYTVIFKNGRVIALERDLRDVVRV